MEKIRNLSLRKTIVLYVAIALLLGFFTASIIEYIAYKTQSQIWQKYVNTENKLIQTQRPNDGEMTEIDRIISELCDVLETWTVLFLPLGNCIIAIFLFYRNKIKEPLQILVDSSKKIAENNLDFQIYYEKRDEMGLLCKEFETMRNQLQENNKNMWAMVEQEKMLKAAIAHDIRSPLAVLRGYQEMLLEFMPQEKLDKNMMEEILISGMQQIDRLNLFVEKMRQLSGIEQREVSYEKIETKVLQKKISETAVIICRESGIKMVMESSDLPSLILGDSMLISEVCENILVNAVRFARNEIKITMAVTNESLHILIEDDGEGFKDEYDSVTKAFSHDNKTSDLQHFGLGLYLCRVYCEKHGGKLLIGNTVGRGAYVTACFRIKRNEEGSQI